MQFLASPGNRHDDLMPLRNDLCSDRLAPQIDVAADVNRAVGLATDAQDRIDGYVFALAHEAQRLDQQRLVVDHDFARDRALVGRTVAAQRGGEARERRVRQQLLARIEAWRFECHAPGPLRALRDLGLDIQLRGALSFSVRVASLPSLRASSTPAYVRSPTVQRKVP